MAYSDELANELNKLIDREPQRNRLGVTEQRPAIEARIGIGEESAAESGLGIESPLTETSRSYSSTPQLITSADGLFTLEYSLVTSINMVDAAGRALAFVYADE